MGCSLYKVIFAISSLSLSFSYYSIPPAKREGKDTHTGRWKSLCPGRKYVDKAGRKRKKKEVYSPANTVILQEKHFFVTYFYLPKRSSPTL